MCGSKASGGVLAITLARPERRNAITVAMYAALADAIEQAQPDPSLRLITLARRGRGLHRRQRPGRLHGRDAARRRGNRGLAAASRARRQRAAADRRGARQCDRHRHHAAAPLRPGRWPRKARAFRCRSSISGWCPKRPARCSCRALPGAAAPRAICCWPSRSGPRKRANAAWSAIVVPKGALDQALADTVAALLAKPAEALRMTQKLLRHGNRDEILERIQAGERPFRRAAESAEVKEAITAFFEKRKPDFTGLG